MDYLDTIEVFQEHAEDGQRDMATESGGSRFLVVQGLTGPFSGAEFAEGMKKFYAGAENIPEGASPGSLKRVILIHDRKTSYNTTYGLAQYRTEKDAEAAFAKQEDLKAVDKCKIKSEKVNVAIASMEIFNGTYGYHIDAYYMSKFEVKEPSPLAAPALQPPTSGAAPVEETSAPAGDSGAEKGPAGKISFSLKGLGKK